MLLSNSMQALGFAAGLSAGFVLSLFYDLLRPLRQRLCHGAAVALDLLYLLFSGMALFMLAQGPGIGAVRSFYLAAAGIGAGAYLCLLSPLVCSALEISTNFVIKVIKRLNKRYSVNKKIEKIIKNIFPNEKK